MDDLLGIGITAVVIIAGVIASLAMDRRRKGPSPPETGGPSDRGGPSGTAGSSRKP